MCKCVMYKSCKTLIIVIFMLKFDILHAYNKARLVRFGITDNPRFKSDHHYHEDTFLEFTERTAKYGYESESHSVITEDGYILTVFRFLKRPHCDNLKQPPVILQHGISVNSMNWLEPGPKAGLAYLLADGCYDLWLANSRGTEFSRNHTKLDPNSDPEYWQFTFHEMGLYDFPATIDYILNKTGNVKLNHISHSQGSAAFLVMGSLRPQYLEKIYVSIAMAPASWLSHVRSDMQMVARNWKLIFAVLDGIGVQEALHRRSLVQESLQFACHSRSYYANKICSYLVSNVDGPHKGSIDAETLTLLFSHIPDGVSLKNLVHLGQIINTHEFKQFDYETENLKYYGKKTPPKYNLGSIMTPIPIMYSDNDQIVHPKDVKTLHEHLKNVPEFYRVPNPRWNHMDYIWSKDIPKYLFPKLNEWLANYTYT